MYTIIIEFYWELGKEIVRLDLANHWGAKLIEQLTTDLRLEFSEVSKCANIMSHFDF